MNFTVFNDILYFSADDGVHGAELWQYDGVNNPSIVVDINKGSSASSPKYFTIYNDSLYFTVLEGNHGRELWVVDPNATASAIKVKADKPSPVLAAFPNPTQGNITIELEGTYHEIKLQLFSYTGQLMLEKQYCNTNIIKINIDVINGMYIMQLMLDNSTYKLIKVIKN